MNIADEVDVVSRAAWSRVRWVARSALHLVTSCIRLLAISKSPDYLVLAGCS